MLRQIQTRHLGQCCATIRNDEPPACCHQSITHPWRVGHLRWETADELAFGAQCRDRSFLRDQYASVVVRLCNNLRTG